MKKIKVFEAFAGIGAQSVALKNIGVDFEIVGISEWFIRALICYDAINGKGKVSIPKSRDEILKYLNQFTFSYDSNSEYKRLNRLSDDTLRKLYKAHVRSKNLGSITEINPEDMPDMDLLIYSFPCQDLSTGGKTLGMTKGSGTRSGLLWEIERILIGLNKLNKLPEYLLMENVKTIFSDSNKKDLDEWRKFLTDLGYSNTEMVLDSYNFGVPQSRKRAFIISHRGEKIDASSLINRKREGGYNIKKFIFNDYSKDVYRMEASEAQLNRTPSREIMWNTNQRRVIDNHTIINTITCNMDRRNNAGMFLYDGPKGKTYRLLTIREAFLMMGFSTKDYLSARSTGFSYRQLNKLIGNSIVVSVLEEIFSLLFNNRGE